jgi:ribosomal protein S18 acetylase RimI-like enzyme
MLIKLVKISEDMMITFEEINEDTLYIAEEIINSNALYNELENGIATRTTQEISKELINNNTLSHLIKLDDTYIGVIDYLTCNPNDNYPWLGLLMIHHDYQGYGFGSIAYSMFEEIIKKQGVTQLRLGVLQENTRAKTFWERKGFICFDTKIKNERKVDCYEKHLS